MKPRVLTVDPARAQRYARRRRRAPFAWARVWIGRAACTLAGATLALLIANRITPTNAPRPLDARETSAPHSALRRALNGTLSDELDDAAIHDLADAALADEAGLAQRPTLDRDELKAALERAHPKLLRNSLAYFMRFGLGMAVGPHHQEWSRLIGKHGRLALLAARGHGKSAFWSYAYPLWRSWRDPKTTGMIVSNTDDQVKGFFRIIRDGKRFIDRHGIEWNMPAASTVPVLQSIVPANSDTVWADHRVFFTNGSEFKGATFGKRFRGTHVEWIVVDDPIDDNAQFSKTVREKAKAFFFRSISPMLLPAAFAQLVVVGTPLHEDDIHAALAKNPEYHHRKYPGMLPTGGGVRCLWPQLRDEKWHTAKRLELGALAYAQEILLKPISNETSLFPAELFSQHPDTLRDDLRLGAWTLPAIREAGLSVFIGVDVAISAEVGSDYTVIVVAGVDERRNRYLLDLERFRGLGFQAQLERIKSAARRYEADLVFIEANQMQVLFSAELVRTTDLPVKPFVTGADKRSLTRGVASLRPLFENGKWRIPRGDRDSIEATDVMLGELKDFAVVDGRLEGVGNHDDTVMALWICDQAVRSSVFGYLGSATLDDHEVAEELRRIEAHRAAQAAGTPGAERALAEAYLAAQPDLEVSPPGQTRWTGPRINPALFDWREAAKLHPEGVEGCRADAATLPDDAATLIQAYNELASGDPRRSALDAAVDQVVIEHGPEAVLAIVRTLLGWG